MSDADLEEIRRARLAQLQQQQRPGGGGGGSGEDGDQDAREQQRDREDPQHNRPQAAEARAHILSQILTPEASDRLGRIRMVKESRATDVENRLIMLARSGQLRDKVSEAQLKDLLEQLAEQQQEREKIVVRRTKGGWDDDEDDDLFDL